MQEGYFCYLCVFKYFWFLCFLILIWIKKYLNTKHFIEIKHINHKLNQVHILQPLEVNGWRKMT